ncbi:hypothetical protein VPMS16_1907 [Vibrio sp. 16]|nr:hypothetical protein VPMS16_1907 [Vibrio sp. 16]
MRNITGERLPRDRAVSRESHFTTAASIGGKKIANGGK